MIESGTRFLDFSLNSFMAITMHLDHLENSLGPFWLDITFLWVQQGHA